MAKKRAQKATSGVTTPHSTSARPPARIVKFPASDTMAHRIACLEVADILSKNLRFKLQVTGAVLALATVVTLGLAAFVGWNAANQIAEARKGVEEGIAASFQTESIQRIINQAAATEGERLLSSSVQPSIARFSKNIEGLGEEVKSKFDKYELLVAENQRLAESRIRDIEAIAVRLKARQEITRLSDLAISQGSVDAYRQLEWLSNSQIALDRDAAASELSKVFDAYGILGQDRLSNLSFTVLGGKGSPEVWTVRELLPHLAHKDRIVRAKVAKLIGEKLQGQKAYDAANIIVNAMKTERDLEVHRQLRGAFGIASGFTKGDTLDNKLAIKWWNEQNKVPLRASH